VVIACWLKGRSTNVWEVRVQHEGLKAYRVVRGVTKEEAELKARLQMAAWNDRWAKRQSSLKNKLEKLKKSWNSDANRQAAKDRTAELQCQLTSLDTILAEGLRRPVFKWYSLKDQTPFTVPRPEEPVPPQNPIKPPYPSSPDPSVYAAKLNLLDRIINSRRAKKEGIAEAELHCAQVGWQKACAEIDNAHEWKLKINDSAHKENLRRFHQAVETWDAARVEHEEKQQKQHAQIDVLREECRAGKAPAVEFFFGAVLNCSAYPESFPQEHELSFDEDSGVLIVDLELPNQSAFPAVKEVKYVAAREEFQEVPVSDAWLKKTYDDVLYQIALKTLHELYSADEFAVLKSIVFNGWVNSVDKATGVETHGCILSVEASSDEFNQINLSQVDPRACFRQLKGIASSKLIELTPVRPILTINKEDHRFVEGYAVAETLDDRTNLAAMDWLDFENLIRELFQEEFSKNGGEVKITQASRDGGVDAVAFDPDPIRGGKIVIQAKRYTNVVGVSAVRDLFGTLLNEGANKGILVTTATYGPDAYEFAKDKPITLLSGGELLSLLAAHGHRAKIDLQEAKALNLQKEQQLKTERHDLGL